VCPADSRYSTGRGDLPGIRSKSSGRYYWARRRFGQAEPHAANKPGMAYLAHYLLISAISTIPWPMRSVFC
jgi:hypothetical protein